MPYISQDKREKVWEDFWDLGYIDHPGDLNFMITELCNAYINDQGQAESRENYKGFNEVMGVLSCVAQEFYRRRVSPYEDTKIEENGDVY